MRNAAEFLLSHALNYVTQPTNLARWLGFSISLGLVAFTLVRQGRGLGRFRHPAFRTDVAYGVWYPVATAVIGASIGLYVAPAVSAYAPMLRLNALSDLPAWLRAVIFLVCSDLSLYWLHRSMHQFPWLWTFHKVHHSQRELNPFTTWRTHWLEATYLSLGAFILALFLGPVSGFHVAVVAVFAASQFAQHSDIDWTYGWIGRVVVSPRFHSRHHSDAPQDADVNFASTFVIWDHLFGTARVVDGRTPSYGLRPADDDVPASLVGQQLYPLWRQEPRERAKT